MKQYKYSYFVIAVYFMFGFYMMINEDNNWLNHAISNYFAIGIVMISILFSSSCVYLLSKNNTTLLDNFKLKLSWALFSLIFVSLLFFYLVLFLMNIPTLEPLLVVLTMILLIVMNNLVSKYLVIIAFILHILLDLSLYNSQVLLDNSLIGTITSTDLLIVVSSILSLSILFVIYYFPSSWFKQNKSGRFIDDNNSSIFNVDFIKNKSLSFFSKIMHNKLQRSYIKKTFKSKESEFIQQINILFDSADQLKNNIMVVIIFSFSSAFLYFYTEGEIFSSISSSFIFIFMMTKGTNNLIINKQAIRISWFLSYTNTREMFLLMVHRLIYRKVINQLVFELSVLLFLLMIFDYTNIGVIVLLISMIITSNVISVYSSLFHMESNSRRPSGISMVMHLFTYFIFSFLFYNIESYSLMVVIFSAVIAFFSIGAFFVMLKKWSQSDVEFV
jgi:hypothetical protein